MTFTKAARQEALKRTNQQGKDFPFLKTIHSICYHQLGINFDQIVRPEGIKSFGKQLGIRLTGNDLDPWIEEFERGNDSPTIGDMLLQANHVGRHRRTMLKDALNQLPFEVDYKYAVWLTKAYRTWKDSNGALDYTDLLTKYVDYGKPLDIEVMFIDEAQDLSDLQWEVVKILGEKAKRWYVAGDDDQAIFNWAGADSSAFQSFEADKVEVLHQSHRLSKAVYNQAMRIVKRIKTRLEKDYLPTESEGLVRQAGYLGSVKFNEKTFILFRNHYRGAILSQVLKDEGIPFLGKNSPMNDLNVRGALFAWHSLLTQKEAPTEAVKRLIKYSDVGYFKPGLDKLCKEKNKLTLDQVFLETPTRSHYTRIFTKLPNKEFLFPYLMKHGFLRVALPNIELMSIHQSKGREAHTVVIDPEMSKACWLSMLKNSDDENRVWYVGVTRAKERIQILLPDGNYNYQF